MPIEDVISKWRSLNKEDRISAINQLYNLYDAELMEKEIEENTENISCNRQKETRHIIINKDFNDEKTVELLKEKKLLPNLIFCSPPYNADINYGKDFDDNKPIKEYVDFLKQFLHNCNSVLKSGGRIIINIRDIAVGKGKRFPIIVPLYDFLCIKNNYSYRGLHIWYKGREESSFAWGSFQKSISPAIIDLYEYIFVFQKGDYPSGEDNMNKSEFIENVLGVWKIRPVKKIMGKNKENILNHPCPFPLELPIRVIKLYSHVGDLVLDPFGGTAATSMAAFLSDRNSVAVEINEEYSKNSYEKLKNIAGKEMAFLKSSINFLQ